MSIDFVAEPVEHFMHGYELASSQIPMRLLRRQSKVDGVGQTGIQKCAHHSLGVRFETVTAVVELHEVNLFGSDAAMVPHRCFKGPAIVWLSACSYDSSLQMDHLKG